MDHNGSLRTTDLVGGQVHLCLHLNHNGPLAWTTMDRYRPPRTTDLVGGRVHLCLHLDAHVVGDEVDEGGNREEDDVARGRPRHAAAAHLWHQHRQRHAQLGTGNVPGRPVTRAGIVSDMHSWGPQHPG